MEIWIATGNKGKVQEYDLLLKELGAIALHTQGELSAFSPRPEDGKTFLENARIKAKTLKAVRYKDWVFGEDSGLEVEGLGNLPGIHSARYAGARASDNENIAKLLKMMTIRPMANRRARFVCSLVVLTPEGEEWSFEGIMPGEIAKAPRGQLGFGYDPVFVPDGQTQTLAELGPGFKVTKSHRALAFHQFVSRFKSINTL